MSCVATDNTQTQQGNTGDANGMWTDISSHDGLALW